MNHINQKTGITASAIGVMLGMAGILNHGIFEIMQGFTPTDGFFIEAISEEHRFWVHGTEAAFTLVPNFLITGILAVIAGSALIVWSLKYMRTRHGATGFLLLGIFLVLVGGGIGFVLVFIPAWAFATRIRKPLDWWRRILPTRFVHVLSTLWIFSLVVTIVVWLLVMELGIFGYWPGLTNPDAILQIVFLLLFSTAALTCFSFLCAMAADIRKA